MNPEEYEIYLRMEMDVPENPILTDPPREDEVSVVQILYGDGRHAEGQKRMMRAPVGAEIAAKAREAKLVLFARIDPATREIHLTVQRPDFGIALMGSAVNAPGNRSPTEVLARLIEEVARASPERE